MMKRKCPSCAKKIEKKFNYCPYCGVGFKQIREEEDFGMLGRDDAIERRVANEIKMPLGLNHIMNSLVKQLEKQFAEMEGEEGMPKGFKIQISTGKPEMRPVQRMQKTVVRTATVDEKEAERRKSLPRVEAKSNVRRLSDRIIYEISVPGVGDARDVVITQLEEGLEIKVYSKDKCYVKVIPLKVEIISYYLQKDVLFIELKA